MGKFLKFFIKEIVFIVFAFVLASALLGLGIESAIVYSPELLEASNTLKILGYCILIGLPFILCYEVLFSFNKAFDRMYEEDDEVVETRAERKIRKLCKKLEKEGVTIVW